MPRESFVTQRGQIRAATLRAFVSRARFYRSSRSLRDRSHRAVRKKRPRRNNCPAGNNRNRFGRVLNGRTRESRAFFSLPFAGLRVAGRRIMMYVHNSSSRWVIAKLSLCLSHRKLRYVRARARETVAVKARGKIPCFTRASRSVVAAKYEEALRGIIPGCSLICPFPLAPYLFRTTARKMIGSH